MTGPLDPAARGPGREAGAGPDGGPGRTAGPEHPPGTAQTPGTQQTPGTAQTPGTQQTPGAGQTPGGERTSGGGAAAHAGSLPGYPRQRITDFLDGLAADAPAPAAGSAIALVLAQAAALCAKVARLSGRRLGAARAADLTARAERLRAIATDLMDQDALAYRAVIEAQRRSRSAAREVAEAGPTDAARVAGALSAASDVPVRLAEIAAETAEAAAGLAADGNPALRGDAITAALLADAGGRAAARLVGINLASAPEDARHARIADLLARLATATTAAVNPGR